MTKVVEIGLISTTSVNKEEYWPPKFAEVGLISTTAADKQKKRFV
jgi:hypothetical protein